MKLVVYKGFNIDFLSNVDLIPLIEGDLIDKKMLLNLITNSEDY